MCVCARLCVVCKHGVSAGSGALQAGVAESADDISLGGEQTAEREGGRNEGGGEMRERERIKGGEGETDKNKGKE